MSYNVEVTEQDLKSGARFGIDNHPVSMAIKRAFFDADEVNVYRKTVYISKNGRGQSYILPQEAATAVYDFDYGLPVKPFKFTIDMWSFTK